MGPQLSTAKSDRAETCDRVRRADPGLHVIHLLPAKLATAGRGLQVEAQIALLKSALGLGLAFRHEHLKKARS